MRQRSGVHEALLSYSREHLGRAATAPRLQGAVDLRRGRALAASLAADANSLVRALLAYDRDRADRAIETALALPSVAHTVEEILLPSLEEIVARHGTESAAWAFAAR